jgi:hypothetical protein
MRNGTECKGLSRWLVAIGILSILAPVAASAADRARSAPHVRSSQAVQAREEAPLLLTDPTTGASVRIWSRSDGFTTKIAWARNDGAGWGAPHDLTFGLGVDRDPSVAITSAGAWLFWRDDRGGVFYAPLEIGSGRLLGVPTSLSTSAGLSAGGGPRPEGSGDIPVTLGGCEATDPTCILQRQRQGSNPGQPNPTTPPTIGQDGTSDIPVTIATATSSTTGLISASAPNCERTIVSVAQGSTLLVSELDGAGRVRRQHTVRIGAGVRTEDAGATAGRFFLKQVCGTGAGD